MATETTITDETQLESEQTTSEQWASDAERLAAETAPESTPVAPIADADLSPEPSPELVTLRTDNARLIREQDERQQQITDADANAQIERDAQARIGQYNQTLLDKGYDQERASTETELQRQIYVLQQQLARSNDNNASIHLSHGKVEIAREFSVSEESLKPFTTLEQAKLYAQGTTGVNNRITALEQRNGQEDRNVAAPVQKFANQARTGAVGNGNYAEKLKSGAALPPASEIDQITAKFLQSQ